MTIENPENPAKPKNPIEPDKNEGITLSQEEYKTIIASLDELKALKEKVTKEDDKDTKAETIRDKLLQEEEKNKEQLEIVRKVESESGLRDYLFSKAKDLGGRVEKIANEYKESYYNKGFATAKTNSLLLSEFITEIATDKEINKFIPKYKENEIKEFLALPEKTAEQQEAKLVEARKLIDVINSTLEIKGRTEEEIARQKAKTSFGDGAKDESQARYYESRKTFKENIGKGMKW